MRPTRLRDLAVFLLIATVVSWGLLGVADARGATLPSLRWTAPAFLLLLAAAVASVALALRPRLRGDKPRPDPLGVARMAVLGKASAHVGPIVGGGYLGYLLLLADRLDVPDPRQRALVCGAALLASALLTAAGLFLEWVCRIRDGDRDDTDRGLPETPAV